MTGWNSEQIKREVDDLMQRYDDDDDPELDDALQALEDREHYLVQLWPHA